MQEILQILLDKQQSACYNIFITKYGAQYHAEGMAPERSAVQIRRSCHYRYSRIAHCAQYGRSMRKSAQMLTFLGKKSAAVKTPRQMLCQRVH